MPLPSYSLAKSLFAGLALMRLEALWPGSANTAIATWVPQCEPGQGWSAITLANAVDMATGRYELDGPEADEDAAIASPLFLAEDHATRIDYACRRYAQRVAPGTRFSYHTSDTYLAVTAMSALWRQKMGPGTDLYRDAMAGQLWRPLGLSPVTFETRRTRDDAGQPFGGWGLFLLRDDLARLGAWLASTPGVIGGRQVLDRRLMTAALQRDPQDRGLREGESGLRYRLGFHAIDVATYVSCRHAVWVPFLSGYGGITLALFPNGVVYYSVSDGGAHHWARAIRGADKIQPMCIE
jgi:hypothetical protein